MLEWVATPYGEVVPKYNGTLLASKVDPLKEARVWVSSYKNQIESADSHLVLGVGGGHHVMEMALQYPNKEFVCIEFLESLSFSHVYAQIRAQVNVELLVGQDDKKIFKSERVQKLTTNTFTILKHLPSWQIADDYYQKIRNAFTAHDWKAFNQVLKFRPREDLFLNEINFQPKSNQTLTAKEIVEFVESKQGEHSDGEMMWMALGELIK